MKNAQFWKPVIASVAATPLLLLLAVGSTGAGHADGTLAHILFPFPLLTVRLLGDAALLLVLLLWLAQFPLYGVALGLAAERGRTGAALLGLLALHGIAAAAELSELFKDAAR